MAARPIWKGAISFGLVHVPVTLYSLEKRADLSFKLIDSRTNSTIRYERINEDTGEEVPWDKIVKGYEYSKGHYVLLDDEDFKNAAVEATQLIEIQNFVDKNAIGDEFFDKPYVLVPQKKAEKGYVLLREVLRESGGAGIARVVIRTREYIAALVPREDALVLTLMRFAQELRGLDEFVLPTKAPSEYGVTERELKLAAQLVESQWADWDPEQYKDEYREKLMEWIEQKVASGGTAPIAEAEEFEGEVASNVVDLVALLRQSVEGNKGGRNGKSKSAPRRGKAEAEEKPAKKARTKKGA